MLNVIVFGLLALIVIATALAMLLTRKPIFSVLFLVLNFASVALLYLILGAPFIAFAQITVYAGAIMVLFLFVIMLLGAERAGFVEPLKGQRWIALILAVVFLVLVSILIMGNLLDLPSLHKPDVDFGAPVDIGVLLFENYTLPFLIISVILLVSTIGAVVLSKDMQPVKNVQVVHLDEETTSGEEEE